MSRRITQKDNVLNHLQQHGMITPLDALKLYGAFRLGAIIHTLRHKHNMSIKSEISDGDKNYAVYSWSNREFKPEKPEQEDVQEGFGFNVKTKKNNLGHIH